MKKKIRLAKATKETTFDVTTFVAKNVVKFVAEYVVKHALTVKETKLIVNFLIELAKVEAKAEKGKTLCTGLLLTEKVGEGLLNQTR